MHPGAPPPTYNQPGPPGPNYYMTQHQMNYGPTYYPIHHHSAQPNNMDNQSTYGTRRRPMEALNEFFGEVKRRQFDANNYAQVGQRLLQLSGIPVGTNTVADYMVPVGVSPVETHGGHLGPAVAHQYSLPLPNLRTKNDLLNVDQILEQMQSTVYESSNAAAAAGVQQPGAHYTHQAINFRQSHSPPQTAIQGATSAGNQVPGTHVTAPMMPSHSSQSASSGTAALTPPSSSVSYTSGHSPSSSHGLSPSRQGSNAAYPTLPPVSASYSTHASAAPASTLANNFDPDPRRRFSGGMLQRSANTSATDDTAGHANYGNVRKEFSPNGSAQSPNIDPSLHVSSPSDSGDSASDRAQEQWIDNIRVIEALRQFVQERLKNRVYEEEEPSSSTSERASFDRAEQNSQNLYPDLRGAMS